MRYHEVSSLPRRCHAYLLGFLFAAVLTVMPALADPNVTPVEIGNQQMLAVVDPNTMISSLPADQISRLPNGAYAWSPGTVQVWWREHDPSLSSAGGAQWLQAMPNPEMQIWDHPYVVVKYVYLEDGETLVDVPFEVTAPGQAIVLGQNVISQAPQASFLSTPGPVK